MNQQTQAILTTALTISGSVAPELPAIISLFSLAATLVSENRDPTAEEWAQLSSQVDSAHSGAQTAIEQAQAAQQAAQSTMAALSPIKAAIGTPAATVE